MCVLFFFSPLVFFSSLPGMGKHGDIGTAKQGCAWQPMAQLRAFLTILFSPFAVLGMEPHECFWVEVVFSPHGSSPKGFGGEWLVSVHGDAAPVPAGITPSYRASQPHVCEPTNHSFPSIQPQIPGFAIPVLPGGRSKRNVYPSSSKQPWRWKGPSRYQIADFFKLPKKKEENKLK